MSIRTYREALSDAMQSALSENEKAFVIGQGVTDHKGIFGTTDALQSDYSDRLIETPIAEDSIAGICLGAALNGMYPINTHIRADFGLLIFNQLINLAAKYKYMFGGLFEVPAMFRMVIGRSWGQGAQHSQSLQSLLSHIPGLVVVMPSSPNSIEGAYREAVNHHRGPVVMLEHRLMYDLTFDEQDGDKTGLFGSRLVKEGKDLTIVATSVMVLEAIRAQSHLQLMGVDAEVIDVHCISHPDHDLIFESVKKTGRLLIVDTSWIQFGVSAEIARVICEKDPSVLRGPVKSLGMAASPCPTAKALEDLYYPDVNDIVTESLSLVGMSEVVDRTLIPQKQSMTDFYKHFKGPF